MVETFTPAVCGSRKRQRVGLALFALGALAAAAALGALLGAAGVLLGADRALGGVVALALLAAAREAGVMRFRVPQARRQVPERWRAELPLPVWSLGYGAGLGAGIFTFQPFATFWVACAAAAALADPLVAAACFSIYGAARAAMVARPRDDDPTAVVERLARYRPALARANVAALVACAALLAAPAARGGIVAVAAGLDPSVSARVLAHAEFVSGASNVLVRPHEEDVVQISESASPAVDGELVAYQDALGIRVVNWRTNKELARVSGAVSKPALDWPLLAFRRDDAKYERLILADFTDPAAPTERQVAYTSVANDLGRPSLRGGRLAWHLVRRNVSRIVVLHLGTGARKVVRKSRIALLTHPAATARRIVWVEQRSGRSYLRMRKFGRERINTLVSVRSRNRLFWTTALAGRTAYLTRWSLATRAAKVLRVTF